MRLDHKLSLWIVFFSVFFSVLFQLNAIAFATTFTVDDPTDSYTALAWPDSDWYNRSDE